MSALMQHVLIRFLAMIVFFFFWLGLSAWLLVYLSGCLCLVRKSVFFYIFLYIELGVL